MLTIELVIFKNVFIFLMEIPTNTLLTILCLFNIEGNPVPMVIDLTERALVPFNSE